VHVVVFFINIGFYHAARLRSAAQACQQKGWRLTAVQLTDDTLEHPWGRASEGLGFPLLTLLNKQSTSKMADGLPVIDQQLLDERLNALKPDILFLPGWSFDLSQKALKWNTRRSVPAVVMSESKRDDDTRNWWKEQLKYWLYIRKFKGALVGGDAHAAYAAELGLPRDRIFKGYDAVDNAHFAREAQYAREHEAEVRAAFPKMPARPFFMAAFRLMARKNALALLDAYVQYRQQCPHDPWDLVICGNGEQRDALVQVIQSHGLSDHVHLVGFLTYHEVGKWYGLAKAFIHPALKEQWGLVVNEACAAGLPVLCSRTVGAAAELVQDGRNGYLFDPADVADIAASLRKVHEAGEAERARMGQESRHLVATCAPEVFGDSVVALTQAVLTPH
jgi:glycosyltransferase involved in cell wall biosynthesis